MRDLDQTRCLHDVVDVAERLNSAAEAPAVTALKPPPTLLFFPDYRATNPYQAELYARFPDPAKVRPGTLEEAARMAARGEDVVFHLHWPEALFADCDTPDRFTARAGLIFAWLRHLRRHGGRSIWTAHNALPHDAADRERQIWFHRTLAGLVDAVHVHDETAADILATVHGIPRDRCFVVPHGARPQPARDGARAAARHALGLDPHGIVFAFVGQLRPYKGIDRLATAFQLARRGARDIQLLIAGKPVAPVAPGHWRRLAETVPGIVVREGYLDAAELETCLAAADAMVLPYDDVLTSGAANMAAERGTPLLLPDHPGLADYVAAGAAHAFPARDEAGLATAMRRFRDLPANARAEMSACALRFSGTRTWSRVSADFARHVDRLAISAPDGAAAAMPDGTSGVWPSLAALYCAGHAAGGAGEAALPPEMAADGPHVLAARALRRGWIDGAAGRDVADDIAARIDLTDPDASETPARGYIDRLDGDRIEGWAAIAAGEAGRPAWGAAGGVWIVEDDVPVAFASTGLIRADLADTGCATDAGFALRVDRNGRRLAGRVDLRCAVTGARIGSAQVARTAGEPGGAEPSPLATAPRVSAWVDGVGGGALVGWARCATQPDRAVFVDVEVDGVRHAGIRADAHRPDLERPGWDAGRHAFELVLPAASCCADALHVRVFENGRDRLLAETTTTPPPATHGYRTDFDPQAYLRWSWRNDHAPVGRFARSPELAEWFAMNRALLAGAAPATGARVSVIMPVHDRRDIVGTAIASVLAQTYADWELIIVDDGSGDGSADEIARIIGAEADPRLSLLRLPEQAGVSAARNAGLARATGDLVAYLDSDNEWAPDFLRVMAAALAEEPEAPGAYCGQEIWQRPHGAAAAELRTVRAAPFNRAALERGNRIDLNVFVHRRALVAQAGGFAEYLRRFVDWDLVLRYTRDRPPRFVPAILCRYNLDAATNRISDTEPAAPALTRIASALSPGPRGYGS